MINIHHSKHVHGIIYNNSKNYCFCNVFARYWRPYYLCIDTCNKRLLLVFKYPLVGSTIISYFAFIIFLYWATQVIEKNSRLLVDHFPSCICVMKRTWYCILFYRSISSSCLECGKYNYCTLFIQLYQSIGLSIQ